MQVIAPDFFAPFGGKSSAREEERAGDGLFDSLLRKEEARHGREPQSARAPREAARPANDDFHVDEPYREEPRDEAPLNDAARTDDRVERPDEPAEHSVAETQADEHDRRPDDDSDTATPAAEADMTQSAAAASTGTASDKPADAHTHAAGMSAAPGTVVSGEVVPQIAAAKNAASQATQPGTTAAASAPAAGAAQKAATQPGGEAAAATPETTAQPASSAAAAQRAGDKAAPTAPAKDPNQLAAAQRQSPSTVPAENAGRPAADSQQNGQPGTQPQIVVTTTASVEARPAAALGGAAATAALAQNGNGQAKTAAPPAETAAAAAAQPGAKPTAQPGPAAKMPEAPAGAGDNKASSASQAAAPTGGDSNGTPTVQTAAPTAAAAGATGPAPLQHASFSDALASARHGQAANPAEQIAVQVQRAQVDGHDKISIKLHPAELGRIEVKLESAHDGTLRAVISAERSETLDLLQRDARGLERALQDAGVKTDSGSLSFNLRGQNQNQGQNLGQQAGSGGPDGQHPGADSAEAMAAPPQQYRSSHSGALDIRV